MSGIFVTVMKKVTENRTPRMSPGQAVVAQHL